MKPRLYLIDAHAFLHRAYHALPPLTTSRGEPVGALYGFARLLLQVVKKEKPQGVAVCFDTPEPTFRHKAYAAYKATRKEIDGDLLVQLKGAKELAEAMGFVCAEAPGFEADDVMATLARKGARAGLEAVLVTGDKDALQMVGPGVRVLKDPAKGLWMDPPQIEERLGVGPESVVDYLALTGDSSDNVPGVPGIGPVGAAKLIKRFKTVDKIVAAAKAGDEAIPPKTAKAIVDGEKLLRESVELVRLREDVPLPVGPADCRLPEPDPARLAPVLERYEFHTLQRELLGAAGAERAPAAAGAEAPAGGGTAVATRPAAVAAAAVEVVLFERLKGALAKAEALTVTAVRGEAGLLESSTALAVVGLEDGRACVLEGKGEAKALAGLLKGKALKVGYDLKETMAALDALGLELGGPIFDTRIAAYCLDPVRPKPEAASEPRALALERAARALGRAELSKRLSAEGVRKLFDDMELPLIPVLRDMEREGVALDAAYLRRLSKEFESDIAALKAELDALAGGAFNANSPKQLGELLFDKLGLPVVHKTAKGGRSTDEEALRALAARHPIPAKVLDYRELTKLKSTYIEGLLAHQDQRDGRVHTRFDQAGAETGRLASLDPNLQNIPIRSKLGMKIRSAFVAPKGSMLVSADYSQIDLRVLAHVSGDPVLKEAFAKGEDVHLRTACEVFHVAPEAVDDEMRRRAKAVNFGIVYGQTAFGLAAQLGIPQPEAAGIIKRYFERYRGVSEWVETNLAAARRDGLARTFLGRVRRLPELGAKNAALRQFWERAARNTPIQGGSADIIKVAMLEAARGLAKGKPKAKMLLQIHDELLFEVPQGEVKAFAKWVKGVMEGAVKLSVPLAVDVCAGRDWGSLEDLEA